MNYRVAVRELCEFTAKEGDLDLRFAPAPTALEGVTGHATVRARRGAGYQSEVALAGRFGALEVRGRADGYDATRRRLEEIKTYRGDLERMPTNHRALHWAQARIYGWLMCEQQGLEEIELALVYFEIGSQRETILLETWRADALRGYFEQQCQRFLAWAELELAHRGRRDAWLAALPFPHPQFRTGQRGLAESVFRAARQERVLLAQAPTGSGKTVGTLFPLLKAMPALGIDKVYYLAAKTSGRALALEAVRGIARERSAPLRVLELVARDKACEHPDKACHGESCPLARGFYDRLPAARAAATTHGRLERAAVRELALEHAICPYYLSQDLVRWSDVVIGDYNYYFDLGALLHGLAQLNDWRIGLLVDEAHNLVERGREMYSAELDQRTLRHLRRASPPALKKDLERLHRAWNALARTTEDAQQPDYQILPELPDKLLGALQKTNAAITAFYAEHPTHADSALQAFYFDLLHFARMAESFGEHSVFDITGRGPGSTRLGIRNVLPAPFLAPRFAAAYTATLFSATVSPWHYYSDMLGLPASLVCVDIKSAFVAEQLEVRIARLSTRYRDRAASLSALVDLVGRQYRAQPGNYLAFFSSFEYLDQAAAAFRSAFPEVPCWEQARGMDEAARTAFLERFTVDGCGIGFAVLGGAFSEGIDLPGTRLVGAFVATLGLPQLNPFNEEIRERMQRQFGAGYDYAYLFPGLRKVVQAAGRVIRAPEDRGVVYLLDDRFDRVEVRALLPAWWQPQRLG